MDDKYWLTDAATTVARFAGLRFDARRYLGLRCASPQALCCRRASRA